MIVVLQNSAGKDGDTLLTSFPSPTKTPAGTSCNSSIIIIIMANVVKVESRLAAPAGAKGKLFTGTVIYYPLKRSSPLTGRMLQNYG